MNNDSTVKRQFSLKSVWDRLTRVAVVVIGAITAMGHWPATKMEWLGVVGAALGASYTGK